MTKLAKSILLITLIVVLVLAAWWYRNRPVTAYDFIEKYSYGDSVRPGEFCSLHREQLEQAVILESPAAYIAKSRNRAVLEKWEQNFLTQEKIDEETFQKSVRLVSDEILEPEKTLRVHYLLLRDWYTIPLFLTINSDGTYVAQYPENPAYHVSATLAPLSCEQTLEKIAPAADAKLYIQVTADSFNIYSQGDSCQQIRPYTTTLLSLITGEIVFSKTEKSAGCASTN